MEKMTQNRLHSLIERYFNAETTISEEKALRAYLAEGKYKLTPEVEEALAVMSVTRCVKRARSHHAAIKWGIAATVAGVLALTGVMQFQHMQAPASYAYVGGRFTEDKAELDRLMNSQVSELAMQMRQSQEEMSSQIAELSEVMQQYENE